MQILRTLYLHGISLPWDLFITERSILKRALQWSLKQMITLSSSQDIGDLVSGNLVNADYFEMFLVLFERSS